MKFDEILRKNVTHDNIHKKSQKVRASPSLSKIKFWKDQRGGGLNWSSSVLLGLNYLDVFVCGNLKQIKIYLMQLFPLYCFGIFICLPFSSPWAQLRKTLFSLLSIEKPEGKNQILGGGSSWSPPLPPQLYSFNTTVSIGQLLSIGQLAMPNFVFFQIYVCNCTNKQGSSKQEITSRKLVHLHTETRPLIIWFIDIMKQTLKSLMY